MLLKSLQKCYSSSRILLTRSSLPIYTPLSHTHNMIVRSVYACFLSFSSIPLFRVSNIIHAKPYQVQNREPHFQTKDLNEMYVSLRKGMILILILLDKTRRP